MGLNNSSIETKVDQLLEYLAEEETASITQAAGELGVPEPTVEAWASALEESGLITRSYSTTQGAILKIKDTEEAREEVEDAEKKAGEKIEKARDEISGEHEELEEVSNLLQGIEESFKKRREISREMKDKIEGLRKEEEVLEKHMEKHEYSKLAEKEKKALHVLEEAEKRLERLGIGSNDEFKEIKKDIEEDIGKIRKVKEGLSSLGGADEFDYKRLLENKITDVKEVVEEQGLDPEKVLEVEKRNKDRDTLKKWLKRKID